MIVDYIKAYRARFGVELICTVLSEHGVKIAPSASCTAGGWPNCLQNHTDTDLDRSKK